MNVFSCCSFFFDEFIALSWLLSGQLIVIVMKGSASRVDRPWGIRRTVSALFFHELYFFHTVG